MTQLKFLTLEENQLTSVDISPFIQLERLNISDNLGLTEIDFSGNPNLNFFTFDKTGIVNLDVSGRTNLVTVHGSPQGEPHLESINAAGCTALLNLEIFGQSNLASVDFSGCVSLETLNIESCMVTDLNLSDCQSLSYLNVASDDNLITLNLNNCTNINYLDISDCINLETLFIKNGKNESVDSEAVYMLRYICADEFQIPYLGGMPSVYQGVAECNSYCSFNPGGDSNTITGVVGFDGNNDGCGVNEPFSPYLQVAITNGDATQNAFVDNLGHYLCYAQSGNYTVTPHFEGDNYFDISPASVVFDDNADNSEIRNFCISPNGNFQDLEIVLTPIIPARPGFDSYYQLIFHNKGTTVQSGEINVTFQDEVLDFISASQIPAQQETNSVSWNYSNLQPFETRVIDMVMNVNGPMETPAVNIGNQLTFLASITPISADGTELDNTYSFDQIVVGSFDPNDKHCLEGEIVPTAQIGEYLHYIINFENTGNFPAERVVIADDIDPASFDINSFQFLFASHDVQSRIVNNRLECFFEGIDLGPNEKGHVVFKIKTNPNLLSGDSVSNKANIYFDYNFPIETNPTVTTFSDLGDSDFSQIRASLYPNPAKNSITIKASEALKSIQIYDLQARPILSKTSGNDEAEISADISGLASGTYFVKVVTDSGQSNLKFVKQ